MEAKERSVLSENSVASLPATDPPSSSHFPMKERTIPIKVVAAADLKPAAGTKKRIQISVKKLREVAPPSHPERSTSISDEATDVPAALYSNKSGSRELTVATSGGVAKGAVSTSMGRRTERLRSAEKTLQPSQPSAKTCSEEAALGAPSLAKEYGNNKKAADIFISQYDAGQKEAVRAVFKQRIQSVPVFKEVKVQLLDQDGPDKQGSFRSAQGGAESATTIAAATAAAIASTAPLLKVQSDLEAKVNSVSEILSKLQETDKQLQCVAMQQARLKAQPPERPPCHHRVSELEKQMTLFMEQRIQHLERLQQQHMNIQSHLISSALNSGGFQGDPVPLSKVVAKHSTNRRQPLAGQSYHQPDPFSTCAGHEPAGLPPFWSYGVHAQRSPLKTPAPRRYAPVPVTKEAKFSTEISKQAPPIGEKENLQMPSYGGTLGGGRLLEQILNSQETPLSPSKEPANHLQKPWHLEREYRTEPSSAFKHPLQDMNPVERTVKKANDVLQDLGQLKKEMNDMLQGAKEWKSDMDHLIKQKESVAPDLHELQLLSKSSIRQTTQASKSILRDAEKILRGVRRNKKVLEENLEAIVHAKDGNALYAFIDALTADREVLEEIRIRKTVDEWIKTITLEIQDEMARRDYQKTQQTIRTMKMGREVKERLLFPPGHCMKTHLPAARPAPKLTDKGPLKRGGGLQCEDSLSLVYGRPVYQGHRSTLKKSPYLRLNSPSPKSKPPRPKLVECVRGTRVKSARTQTRPCAHSHVASPKKPRPFSAPPQEMQYLFSPIKESSNVLGPLEGHLIPMAIPLGQKQIDRTSPQPAGIIIGEFHPVTVTSPVPPAPPKPSLKVKKPNVAVIEVRSENKDPPKLTVQVLPNIDIDTVSSDVSSVSQALSEPHLTKAAMQLFPKDGKHEEEEQLDLPGMDFVDVTDICQEEEEEGMPEFGEPVLEFNRQGETASPQYLGLPFPPAPPVPQPSADVLEDIIEKRETLENRLACWVEQEVMARVISGMISTQKEAVPEISSSESEESRSVSSDIVEAAGPKGFQLFVSAGVPVDSDMIRCFVNEALAERVALMLGDREDQKETSAAAVPSCEAPLPEKETLLPTPLVTPQATPPASPSPVNEPSQVKTPASSPSVTELDGNMSDWRPVSVAAGAAAAAAGAETAAISPISTPVATPAATPPKVATPSPPASERHATDREVVEIHVPPLNAWGDAELPLEEEKPSSQREELGYRPRAIIMSVATHEEPDSLVLPASPEQDEPHDVPLPEPSTPPPSARSPSSGPSTEESSLNLTGTTADRPISEGEVLFSYGQLVAARGLAEEGLPLPRFCDSLSSTLNDPFEMGYDPPSEGQVIRRSPKGGPVFTLFSKRNEVPLASQEDICQSEDTDNSVGELSEGQRPRLTKAAENILMGCSVRGDRPVGQAFEQPPRQTPSPGQYERVAGDVLGETEVTRGPLCMADLVLPASPTTHADGGLAPRLDAASQETNPCAAEAGQVQSRVIQVKARLETAEEPGVEAALPSCSLPAPAKVSVMIPSANTEDQTQSLSSIHGNLDSSGEDTF